MQGLVLRRSALALLALGACTEPVVTPTVDELTPADDATCPAGMVVNGDTCIDAFEAHVEMVSPSGEVLGVHPPNKPLPAEPKGFTLRAGSARGVLPQAHVSQRAAAAACSGAEKRLCSKREWLAACQGPSGTLYPYGTRARGGACNDRGVEVLAAVFKQASPDTWGFDPMNDPRLHLVPGGPARTGRFTQCVSEVGAFDMVGNLHEWTDDPGGEMLGGFYLDTRTLGEGCRYGTRGHDEHYRDYSTGFRCCAAISRR